MPRILDLTHLIWLAGLIQIAEAAANLALPPKIHMRGTLADQPEFLYHGERESLYH